MLGGDQSPVSPFIRGFLTRNADGSISPPDNIIKTLPAAYQQYISVRNDNLERILVFAAIEGMIAGNPPYDQDELDAAGLGHISNFNNFKARSAFERAATAYWNLINATEIFVKINLRSKYQDDTGEYIDIPDIQYYADTMARHFSDVLKEWPDFCENFNLIGAQLVKFGLAPIFFPHEESPIWEVVDTSRYFIPSQTQSFVSKLTNVAIDTTYTVQELFTIYEKADDSSNWNKKALGDYLILRANAIWNSTTPFRTMMELQRYIDNNDANVSRYFTDNVRLVNMYQVEYDKQVSHYIFSAEIFNTTTAVPPNQGGDLKDFLFFCDRQYSSLEDATIIFTSSPGEWTIHGNLGLGQKMFAPAQAVNMMDCAIVDTTKIAGTPLINTLATGGRESAATRFYPGVVTDMGSATFVENTVQASIQPQIAAAQYLTGGLEANAVNSGDNPGSPDVAQGSISAPEARQRSFKEFGVLKNAVAHFYNTFDKVVRTMFIRFLSIKEDTPGYDYAKEWRTRCEEDGVPEWLFSNTDKGLHGLPRQFRAVKASRVAGDGSTLARIMSLEALDKIAATFDEEELTAYKKEWVAATCGVDYIPTFAPTRPGQDEDNGNSLAVLENSVMQLGGSAGFSADDDQKAHATTHLKLIVQVVQGIQAGQISAVDGDKILGIVIPHEQDHVAFMDKSPQFYALTLRQIEQPLKQAIQFAQLNRRNAEAELEAAKEKQQQDAAATDKTMTDIQRKDAVASADIARKDRDSEAKNKRAQEGSDEKAAALRSKTDADNRAKLLATVKGREQDRLSRESVGEIDQQLKGIQGTTPSNQDFEGGGSSPSVSTGSSFASSFGLPPSVKEPSYTRFKVHNEPFGTS